MFFFLVDVLITADIDRLPGPAVNLSVKSVTSTRVLLTWSKSSFNDDSLLYYIVQYQSRDASSTGRNVMVILFISFGFGLDSLIFWSYTRLGRGYM